MITRRALTKLPNGNAPPWLSTVAGRPIFAIAAVILAASATPLRAVPPTPVYVTPDVPTRESLGGTDLLSWMAYRYDGLAYTPALTVPGNPALADIHRMDKIANWLFALEAPSNLGGALPSVSDTRDVIRYDGTTATYSVFFCGAGLATPIPPGVGVDAVYLSGGDAGALILSFDAPVTLPPFTFNPADLVRFVHSGPGCGGWTLPASNPEFNSAAAGIGIKTSTNLVAADHAGGKFVFSFDVPTDVGPPGVTTYVPGQLVAWDGLTFSLFEPLTGWPISGIVAGVSASGNPGRVPPTIQVNKAGANITVSWSGSCSAGAEDYAIYEGKIGSWYSHTSKVCTDTAHDLTETFAPAAGSNYYLVVPRTLIEEGSYGAASGGAERPVGAAVCVSPQVVTDCP